MKRLISTLNLSKEDWLRYRKCGITGTDAGAIPVSYTHLRAHETAN